MKIRQVITAIMVPLVQKIRGKDQNVSQRNFYHFILSVLFWGIKGLTLWGEIQTLRKVRGWVRGPLETTANLPHI